MGELGNSLICTTSSRSFGAIVYIKNNSKTVSEGNITTIDPCFQDMGLFG